MHIFLCYAICCYIDKYSIVLFIETTASTVELQQDGNPAIGSNGVKLTCIVTLQDDKHVDRVFFQSKSGGTNFNTVIVFDITNNATAITEPGSYLEGRVTLKNLLSSENRTVVEYNKITCEDNNAYKCNVHLTDYNSILSEELSIEVTGKVPVILSCKEHIEKGVGTYSNVFFQSSINHMMKLNLVLFQCQQ